MGLADFIKKKLKINKSIFKSYEKKNSCRKLENEQKCN